MCRWQKLLLWVTDVIYRVKNSRWQFITIICWTWNHLACWFAQCVSNSLKCLFSSRGNKLFWLVSFWRQDDLLLFPNWKLFELFRTLHLRQKLWNSSIVKEREGKCNGGTMGTSSLFINKNQWTPLSSQPILVAARFDWPWTFYCYLLTCFYHLVTTE